MKYTVSSYKDSYIVKKNNTPIFLKGVGLLVFKTKQEAQDYIKQVYEAAYYIRMGIPE